MDGGGGGAGTDGRDGGSFIFDSVRQANSRPSIDLTDSSENSIFHLSLFLSLPVSQSVSQSERLSQSLSPYRYKQQGENVNNLMHKLQEASPLRKEGGRERGSGR